MVKFQIICLQVCFLQLFMNDQFSNAISMKVNNPDTLFGYSALLGALFVKSPNQDYFVEHVSTQPMRLCAHKINPHDMSFYEMNSPYTLFTFKARLVSFEILLISTMSFKVDIDNQIWSFRCMFADEQKNVDNMYIYLSLFTAQGSLKFKMEIDKVESYSKIDTTSDPIIYSIEGLQPGKLYESNLKNDIYSNKMFDIKTVAREVAFEKSRLAFRTDFFRMKVWNEKVVLGFNDFPGFFYICYFYNSGEALKFARTIAISDSHASPDLILEIPYHLQSYLNRDISNKFKQPMWEVEPSPTDNYYAYRYP